MGQLETFLNKGLASGFPKRTIPSEGIKNPDPIESEDFVINQKEIDLTFKFKDVIEDYFISKGYKFGKKMPWGYEVIYDDIKIAFVTHFEKRHEVLIRVIPIKIKN